MKITLVFIAFLICTNAVPLEFNLGGWNGVINSFGKINGVESENNEEMNNKAEKVIKGLIEKHLAGKKKNKSPQKQKPQEVQPVPQEVQQSSLDALKNVNWDKNPEMRDLINAQIPGGVASVEALINLLQEQQK